MACNRKYAEGKPVCTTPHLAEEDIKARFLKVYNAMIDNKQPAIDVCNVILETYAVTEALDKEIEELLREMDVVAELTRKCISDNASTAQDQDEYNEKYNSYVERYEKAKSRYDELTAVRSEKISNRKAVQRFLRELLKRTDHITEFDPTLWLTVVDQAKVCRDGTLVFRFVNGAETVG